MPIKTTTSTIVVSKTYRIPFDFKGNIDATVRKSEFFGDGNIDTGSSIGQTVRIGADIYDWDGETRTKSKDPCVMLRLGMTVYEDHYREKGYEKTMDDLSLSKDLYIPLEVGDYEEKDANGKVTKRIISREFRFPSNMATFFAARHFRGKNQDYMPLSSGSKSDIPEALEKKWSIMNKPDQLPNWLPISELQVKIDGEGSELRGKGNMAIKGIVEFTIDRTDEIIEFTYTDPIMGNERKVENFHASVDTVLGRGYDICGRYAKRPNKDKVIDYEKLNEYRRIQQALGIRDSESDSYKGENIREYTSHRESKMSIKVSASAFGASFSKETEESFLKDSEKKTGHRFATLKQFTKRETYQVQGYDSPSVLMDFLTPQFLEDLNTQTAGYIIDHYGTHVVLGMVVGASLLFNMDYQQSLIKQSAATAYSDKTSVKFDIAGNLIKSKLTESAESVTEKLFNAISKKLDEGKDTKDLSEMLKALTEYLSKAPNSNSPNPTGNYGDEYSESIKNSLKEEDESEHIRCFVTGGNDALALAINIKNDLSKIEEWAKTVDENSDFCDFIPGTLIPIYTLIPNGYKLTPRDIEAASSNYQTWHKKDIPNSYKRGVKTIEFDTLKLGNTTIIKGGDFIETKDKPVS